MSDGTATAFLLVRIAGEPYAVACAAVEEALEDVQVRSLAGMPRHLAGVVRHRGAWLPVVDPRQTLELPPGPPGAALLVARRGRARFGITVDAVDAARVVQPETSIDGIRVIRHRGRVAAVLEPAELFQGEIVPEVSEPDAPVSPPAATRRLVVFRVVDLECGVDVSLVNEVVPYVAADGKSDGPSGGDGVADVRGERVAYVDLRHALLGGKGTPPEGAQLLRVAGRPAPLALLVDEVDDVVDVRADQVHALPALIRRLGGGRVEAFARPDEERLILVLRLDGLLPRAADSSGAPAGGTKPTKRAGGARKRASAKKAGTVKRPKSSKRTGATKGSKPSKRGGKGGATKSTRSTKRKTKPETGGGGGQSPSSSG